ncbi:MAG: tetratricopeptide repeat protein [Proteobacteria bacterium]|nr:tetratricopeptide repeat protein [Pseudomonadota bacterium]
MSVSVPIQYDDLFEFLEDYRSSISQLQYIVPVDQPVNEGDAVAVEFTVPVLGEVVTAHGRVSSSEEGAAALALDPDAGDGIPQLEGFYRFVGSLVEAMLVSGRFKVTGQWAAGAGYAAAGASAVARVEGQAIDLTSLTPDRTGVVEEVAMTELLMDLYRLRGTGVLEVRSETGRRLGWMKKGGFVQWENDPVIEDECLGVLLNRAGKLTEEQLKHSLTRMNETGQRQGECLIESGALTFPQLVMSLMTQAEIVTRNVFAMREGTWSWFPLDPLPGEYVTPPMKTPGFLFTYYKKRVTQTSKADLQKMQTPLMDQYTILADDINWDDLRLKKTELGLVDILSRKSYRYREIFSVSNMGRGLTMQVALALVQLGVLGFVDSEDTEQVMERLRKQLVVKLNHQMDQNPFEILEVHWTSLTPAIRVSYDRMKAEYDRFGKGVTLADDVESRRQEILTNIEGAWKRLNETATRQETRKQYYEAQQHDFSADLLFRQGEMLVMRKKYSEAVDALERAVELMPHVAKYRAMLKTARRDGAGGDGSFEI